MDPRRHHHRVRGRLPRRDASSTSPSSASGRTCRPSVVGVLEGQAYVVSGYLAVLAALLILAGALVRPLRPPTRSTPSGLAGFALTSALCGLAPTLEWLVALPAAPGRGRRAARPGLAGPHHARLRGRRARGRAFGIWAAATSALTLARAARRRDHGRHHRLAVRVPHQRPVHRVRAVGHAPPRRGVARHRGGRRVRLARRARRGARDRRALVRAHPRPGAASGPTPLAWIAIGIGVVVARSCSRSSWRPDRTRWCRSASSGRARSRPSTSRRSSSTARCT